MKIFEKCNSGLFYIIYNFSVTVENQQADAKGHIPLGYEQAIQVEKKRQCDGEVGYIV